MLELDTERLHMRQMNAADWDLFLALHTDPKVIQYVCDLPSERNLREKFDIRLPEWSPYSAHWLCLVVSERHSGLAIGVTGLQVVPDVIAEAEVGYLLLAEHHGKGYGVESLQSVVAYARDTLSLNRLTAVVTDGNIPSCRVLEKCGFVLESRIPNAFRINGQLVDDLIYGYWIAK